MVLLLIATSTVTQIEGQHSPICFECLQFPAGNMNLTQLLRPLALIMLIVVIVFLLVTMTVTMMASMLVISFATIFGIIVVLVPIFGIIIVLVTIFGIVLVAVSIVTMAPVWFVPVLIVILVILI